MFIRKKFLISLLIALGLVGGMAGLNASSPQVSAKTRYFVRYLNGKYNLFHNVPGRRKSYLIHYGRNYKNQKVYTGGTYWHNHKHYTRVVRNRRFFGFMNIAGGSRRKPRMRYHRRYVRHFARRHPRQNYASNYIERSNDSDTPSYKYNVELGHTWFRSNSYKQYKLAKKDRSLIDQGLYTYDTKHNTMDPTQKLTAEEYQSSHASSDNSDNEANQNSSNAAGNTDANDDSQSSNPQPNPQSEQAYEQAVNARTIQDVNQDRAEYGEQPLQVSDKDENIAAMREQQESKNFTHFDNNGHLLCQDDAKALGYPYWYVNSENAAAMPLDKDSTANTDEMNDIMMNHDQSEGNGHRKNILDNSEKYIGVKSNINQNKSNNNKTIYIVEDFD